MKTTTFSPDVVEKPSLNFHLLREEGLAYLQKLSKDHWTDYNSHDPGVTILEQLCFALTDVAYRLEYPIADLLAPSPIQRNLENLRQTDSFFEASRMLSSHAVTILDQRKMLIDAFEEIQNVWIEMEECKANEEKMILTKRIDILPNLLFNSAFKTDEESKQAFLKRVRTFLEENRNLAEDVVEICLLESENLDIHIELSLEDDIDVEPAITEIFIALFELIYRPIHYHSVAQLVKQGYDSAQLFSGPRLSKGIVKDETLKERVTKLNVNGLEKLLSRVEGVSNCKIPYIKSACGLESKQEITIPEGKFFHLLEDPVEDNILGLNSQARFFRLFENLTIYSRNKEIKTYNKNKIVHLAQELWSKKYRQYPQALTHSDNAEEKLKGTYRNSGKYHSIQHQFPLIYGVGRDGVSSHEPLDRQGKAKQLKGYLMLFEQQLANYLAQIENLNSLFSIDYNPDNKHSYFHQQLQSVPDVSLMYRDDYEALESIQKMEDNATFYHRKNRMYDHLLARFGEDLNPLPWKIGYHLQLFSTEDDYEDALLQAKAALLKTLESLSYYRVLGERFRESDKTNNQNETASNDTYDLSLDKRPLAGRSGLASIVSAKMGFTEDGNRFIENDKDEESQSNRLVSEDFTLRMRLKELEIPKEIATDIAHFRSLELPIEIVGVKKLTTEACVELFAGITHKTVLKRGICIDNYRVSNIERDSINGVEVIFDASNIGDNNTNKEHWIQLLTCSTLQEAQQQVVAIMDFLRKESFLSEGLYVVDHILLRDFLEAKKEGDENVETTTYGFSFFDKDDTPVFEFPEDTWCHTIQERDARLEEVCKVMGEEGNYFFDIGHLVLKGCNGDFEGKTLLTHQSNDSGYSKPIKKEEIAKIGRNFAQLFYDQNNDFGRLRLKEVEGIRLRGDNAKKKGVKGQRRLVFQRKLKDTNEIINEDFFNLRITVFLPDWSARFQESRFLSYLKDVIKERTPAHIQCDIVSLGVDDMHDFEEDYFNWRYSRSYGNIDEQIAEAHKLYRTVQRLKTVITE